MSSKLLLFILFLVSSTALSADYKITDSESDNLVSFESDAKLEFVSGRTHNINGYFSFNPDSPRDTLYGIIRVDLRDLKTGIDLRDKHMRERHLETDEFPYAYFELTSADNLPQSILPDSVYQINGTGFFYLHGFKQLIHPQLSIQIKSVGDIISVTADFQILLEEFHIKRPKALFLKLAKKINIQVKFNTSVSTDLFRPTLPPFILNN